MFGNRLTEGMNGIEGLTNDEAIQNIASLYNKEQMKVKNLEVTGELIGPTITDAITKLEKSIAAQVARLDRKINGVAGQFGGYVKKGTGYGIRANYTHGGKKHSNPLSISDGWHPRAMGHGGQDLGRVFIIG